MIRNKFTKEGQKLLNALIVGRSFLTRGDLNRLNKEIAIQLMEKN